MAGARSGTSRRPRGSIDELPSGALRVRVYAGVDPVTRRRHDLIEVVPPGPQVERQARAVRDRLISEVEQRRNPRTRATVDQLLERYLEQFDGAPNTLTLYRGYVRNHISPLLGHVRAAQLDAEMLDAFYAELRRCRAHCTSGRAVDHRTPRPHECDDRCRPHRCRPLGPTTVRHMHFILSGAFKRAVRWRWVAVSPVGQAEPPADPKPNPEPPTPAEAARIVTEGWRDPDWGTLLWTAMTTGARRGELCAARWSLVDLTDGREALWLRRAIRKEGGRLVEADLKTHQQRRIALDAETVAVLREHHERCRARAAALGFELAADAFVFSGSPDGATFPVPDSVTQRYDRLAARLGIETTFHRLRHYSATELITGGVDPQTVAGRLGHGSGGTTTLRTYTARVSEADQRAAKGLGARMPTRPQEADDHEPARHEPRHPYERVAAALGRDLKEGRLAAGAPAPTAADLATRHGVSLATARRGVALAKQWGVIVDDGRGRPRLAATAAKSPASPAPSPAPEPGPTAAYWSVVLVAPDGTSCPARTVRADLADPVSFHRHALGIARAALPQQGDVTVTDHELEVRKPGSEDLVTILRCD